MLEETWGNYKLNKRFRPKGKTFVFNLDEYSCYKLNTGVCSMDCEKNYDLNDMYVSENSIQYCPKLANSLKQYGVTNINYPVRVIKNTCGHYSIEDGQHRLCSASKEDLGIDVYIQESEYTCRVCHFKKKSIKFRILSWIGKNKEFIKKL